MVLWEITVATAYLLGLKRTYRLALKLQRRIVSPNHPKIQNFLRSRTRAVFDIALQVHHNIQKRDIEVGRNVGNWILRWLDRMKPSANIRGTSLNSSNNGSSNMNTTKRVIESFHLKNSGSMQRSGNQECKRHLFTSSRNVWGKALPTISIIRPPRPGSVTQYRHLSFWGPEILRPDYGVGGVSGFNGFIRKDIMQYLLQN
ncbi:hypothetical protein K2173_002750 [Erythroxylum novogranatense]|uniref:Uncharacterized protein n=1 Tax=Erythroxylum novogranatense TaxID=1862640 RepID=A0AAV8SQQ4_9ROSI|nr:hypothetical protein K2173_002750 [Erythroxylum novogranatense]